jgi:hypothetical protein
VRALEALEDGDPDEAAAFLRSALHDRTTLRYRCRVCGSRFEWPGQLDDHDRLRHGYYGDIDDGCVWGSDEDVDFVNEELADARGVDRGSGLA